MLPRGAVDAGRTIIRKPFDNTASCIQSVGWGDRALIYGALLWMADKLESDQGDRAREVWAEKGKRAFEADREGDMPFDQ